MTVRSKARLALGAAIGLMCGLHAAADVEAAQVWLTWLWYLFLQKIDGLPQIVSGQRLLRQADVRRVKVLASDELFSARLCRTT